MAYNRPNPINRIVNGIFGLLLRLGIGLPHNVLLQVRGRKTGRIYSMPVNILAHNGRRYLVAPRGDTQWSRNARASGEAIFVKGLRREHVKLRPIADADRPEILKAYLDRFAPTVQRYFTVRAGASVEEFEPIASTYHVFEIVGSTRL
jgi:deazaflavin-dependent oxidoreductase (nitroreductase family)